MNKARQIDPTATTVEVDGRSITLAEVAAARDHVRAGNIVLDPYPVSNIEVRESGAGGGAFTITGHAAVFSRWSLDLGGFREQIAPGAFAPVLELNPDVHAVWDHDTRLTLARTKNNTLELREDARGLFNWMRVAPTSFAADLRVLMERGDIDQQSFAFTVDEDEWETDEDDDTVSRTINRVRDLYDVTITAAGAYPQTSAELERSIRQVLGTTKRLFAIPNIANLPGSEEEPESEERSAEEDSETRDAAPAEEDAAVDSPSQSDEEMPEDTEPIDRDALLAEVRARIEELGDLNERAGEL